MARRDYGLGVLDEVTDLATTLVADGLVQREGLPGVSLELEYLVDGDVEHVRKFRPGGLAA